MFKWANNYEKVDPFETSEVRILAVTWNMAGGTPTLEDFKNLLHADSINHDIYVIGS